MLRHIQRSIPQLTIRVGYAASSTPLTKEQQDDVMPYLPRRFLFFVHVPKFCLTWTVNDPVTVCGRVHSRWDPLYCRWPWNSPGCIYPGVSHALRLPLATQIPRVLGIGTEILVKEILTLLTQGAYRNCGNYGYWWRNFTRPTRVCWCPIWAAHNDPRGRTIPRLDSFWHALTIQILQKFFWTRAWCNTDLVLLDIIKHPDPKCQYI